jgi:hypothetical protein
MKNWRYYVGLVVVGLGIALGIAFLSPLASSDPDGLEKVAEDKEFIHTAEDAPYQVIADYALPWVDNEDLATVLAGIIGVLIVAALISAIGFALLRLRKVPRPTSRTGGQA